MTAEPDFPELHVLVGAGSFSDAQAALRLVQRLPNPLFAGLGGLLIAEPEVFAACKIRRQRVILPSGAMVGAPAPSELQLLMQADAHAFQDAISNLAESARAGWVFEQDQGDLISTSLRAAGRWDVLLMAHRRIHPKTGKVILLRDANAISDKMQFVSQSLSRAFLTDKVELSVAGLQDSPDTQQSETSRRFETLDDCIHALARANGLVVLLDLKGGPITSQSDLARVLDAARCPVMIFGAAEPAQLEHSTQIPPRAKTEPPQ